MVVYFDLPFEWGKRFVREGNKEHEITFDQPSIPLAWGEALQPIMALWTSLRSLWGVHGYQAGARPVPFQLDLWSLDGVGGVLGHIGVFAAFAVGGWSLGALASLQRGRSGTACAFRCAVLDFEGCSLSDPWWSRKGQQNRLPSTHPCHLCCGSGAS